MPREAKQRYVRSSLNKGQIEILGLLFQYRFGSRELLGNSLGLKIGSSLYTKLEVLRKHGYIDKRFEKQLKLDGVPAAYYLLPKGMRVLQSLPEHGFIDDAALRATYKDKGVSQGFIMHTLDVYKNTQLMQRRYPSLKVFTKRDMSRQDYFPEQLPDVFLSLPSNSPKAPHRFFLDVIAHDTPRYLLERRIANYHEFFDEGGWDKTGSELPVMLFLSESSIDEKRIRRWITLQVNRLEAEMRIYTSTRTALQNATEENAIWTAFDDADELISLDAISVTP